MKKFILLRHGKAEMSGEDHLRKLDSEGTLFNLYLYVKNWKIW